MNKRLVISSMPEADTHPQLFVDEGKNGEGVGQWVAQQKHVYLSTYIDAARSAARTPWSTEDSIR